MEPPVESAYPSRQLEKWLPDNGFFPAVFLGRTKHAVRVLQSIHNGGNHGASPIINIDSWTSL